MVRVRTAFLFKRSTHRIFIRNFPKAVAFALRTIDNSLRFSKYKIFLVSLLWWCLQSKLHTPFLVDLVIASNCFCFQNKVKTTGLGLALWNCDLIASEKHYFTRLAITSLCRMHDELMKRGFAPKTPHHFFERSKKRCKKNRRCWEIC